MDRSSTATGISWLPAPYLILRSMCKFLYCHCNGASGAGACTVTGWMLGGLVSPAMQAVSKALTGRHLCLAPRYDDHRAQGDMAQRSPDPIVIGTSTRASPAWRVCPCFIKTAHISVWLQPSQIPFYFRVPKGTFPPLFAICLQH